MTDADPAPTRCRSARSPCTAWSATSSARRCRKSRGNTVDPLDWIDRFGADATRFTLARGASPGSDVCGQRGVGGRRQELLQQAVERHPVRAAERRGRRPRRCPGPASSPSPTAGSCPGSRRSPPRSTSCSRRSSSARPARRCTTSPGTSSATGTWSWPRRRWRGDRTRPRRPGPCSAHVLDRLLRLLHPVMPVRHRRAVDGPDRRRLGDGGALAGPARPRRRWRAAGAAARPGGRSGDREPDAAGHAGAQVPLGPGAARVPAGARGAGRNRRDAAGRPRGQHPLAAAARGARRGVRAHGIGPGRGGHRAAGHGGGDRRRRRAAEAGEGSFRRPRGRRRRPSASSPPRRSSSGRPRRWWPAAASGWRPPRPRSPGWSSAWRRCRDPAERYPPPAAVSRCGAARAPSRVRPGPPRAVHGGAAGWPRVRPITGLSRF